MEARKVEKIQEIYLEALQAYVMNHRVRPMTEFAKLLSVLTELRTLGNLNSEMCFSLKLKNKKLPPFLAEIWDVHSWTTDLSLSLLILTENPAQETKQNKTKKEY